MDDLGGPDVHAKTTGQIDLAAKDPEEAAAMTRRFLSYLPSNSWTHRREPKSVKRSRRRRRQPRPRGPPPRGDMRKLVKGVSTATAPSS